MTSYRRSIATIGLSRVKRRFSRKSQVFPTPCIFRPEEGVALGIEHRRRKSKTSMMRLPGRERSLTIFSAVWIQYNTPTWRTDGRTPGDSKDRAYA